MISTICITIHDGQKSFFVTVTSVNSAFMLISINTLKPDF